MTHADFFVSNFQTVSNWASFEDCFTTLEEQQHWTGGMFSLEQITSLHAILTGSEAFNPVEVQLPFATSVQLFLVPSEIQTTIRHASKEELYESAKEWSTNKVWNVEVNAFDLAGTLVSLQLLCFEAQRKQLQVYLLFTPDDQWINSE